MTALGFDRQIFKAEMPQFCKFGEIFR